MNRATPARVDRRGRAHLESEIEAWFVKRVRLLGGKCIKLVPIHAGYPDRLLIMPGGKTFFVELKQDGEQPTEIQRLYHEQLQAIGHPVYVVRGKDEAISFLRHTVERAVETSRKKPGPKPRA